MLIHKGNRFEISSDGDEAVKSDGRSSRRMRFYPERDVTYIAGELDAISAWRLLHDVSLQAIDSQTPVDPSHVLIDGDGFHLSEWSESRDSRFRAPEGYSPVWALGATLFYAFLGCHPFQGRGGAGQSPSAPVPLLRKELPELSSLIARCLDYNPRRRPTLREIADIASENIKRCKESQPSHPPLKVVSDTSLTNDQVDSLWPDDMT